MPVFLSHAALSRVVQSLLTSELDSLRHSRRNLLQTAGLVTPWADDLDLGGSSTSGLGCDSLELLELSAAINEMFHLHEVGLEMELLRTTRYGDLLPLIEDAWRRGIDRITLTTSGSTGAYKRCTHTFDYLYTEATYLASIFQGRSRIVALTPARHIYGLLFTALLPDLLKISLLEGLCGNPDDRFAKPLLVFRPGDLIVSVPEVWQWLDRSIETWPPGINGVISTGPCPRTTIASLAAKGLAKVTEVYGSSETAGVGVRIWPEEKYVLMPHWSRPCSDSSSSEVLLHISGLQVSPMDELVFSDETRFVLRRRKDGAVQVGGTNVFLHLVESKLLQHPEVKSATVRLMRPEEGNRLKGFIVPAQNVGPVDLQETLERWLDTWPIPAERPRSLTFGSELPRNTLGKLCDW